MITLTDRVSILDLDLASWDGDAYVTVKVNSRGYCGENDLHILAGDFRQFCSSLISLQKNLKGSATLTSVHPEELFIEIKPFGSLGHFSVLGKFGYHISTSHSSNWHSVEFGFEIEPQQLDMAVKAEWVKKYSK